MKHLLIVIGTRPKTIKLAPPVNFKTMVCTNSQHRQILEQAVRWFDLPPDENWNVMREKPSLANVTAVVLRRARGAIAPLFSSVVVQDNNGIIVLLPC